MASFEDVLYYVYADTLGGSEKVQKYADVLDVICGWSFSADLTLDCAKTYSIE